jgi:glycosyltransferase involved in cell wall biosynthesis
VKILVANDTYPPDVNGSAYFTRRLAEGLAGRGHEVHVLCPAVDRRGGPVHRGGVVEHRVRSLPLPGQRGFRVVPPAGSRGHARRVLATVDPDVVHLQGHLVLGRALLAEARAAGVPVVATNHFMPDNLVPYLRLPGPAERLAVRAAWRDLGRVFSGAHVVTAPTPTAAGLVEAALAAAAGVPGPVLPVSCGIDLARFRPGRDAAGFRRAHGLAGPGVTLGHVGRLDPEKHVADLVRVLPLLPAAAGVRLLVVGRGHEEDRLRDLARRCGVADRVRFAGFVPDAELPAAYAAMDVFCALGTAELQCIAALEAMASGLPLVAADAHALPHLVRPGRNGALVPPGDVAALAAALTPLVTDAARRRAAGAESRAVVAGHDLDRTLGTFEDLYTLVRPGTPARGPAAADRPAVPVP